MMSRIAVPMMAFLTVVLPQTLLAQECEDGQVLKPGERCEVTVKWGHDHWVKAEFAKGDDNAVVFTHLEGNCNVSLFGPEALDNDLLGPDLGPASSELPGEYHLFTRAITVAKEACRYSVSVD